MHRYFFQKRLVFLAFLFTPCLFMACILDPPLSKSTAPNEFQYNHWLLESFYIYPQEIQSPSEYQFDLDNLYGQLSDPYTRYIPPANKESTETQINTSYVAGDIGLEILLNTASQHPLFIYRVYPQSPAEKAGIQRYSSITKINGMDLSGENAYSIYQTELATNKTVTLHVSSDSLEQIYILDKKTFLTPTVFIDTIHNIPFISITGFKPHTIDHQEGSLGELKDILKRNQKAPLQVLDLRNNLGGHLNQCIAMADLFVEKGVLSSFKSHSRNNIGAPTTHSEVYHAKKGDIAESQDFLILVNRYTASCAEIFVAALAENRNFLVIGEATYGKAVGQNTWKTKENGLAIITGMEFLTPNNTNYNRIGIQPNIPCSPASYQCIYDLYPKLLTKNTKLDSLQNPKSFSSLKNQNFIPFGGAIKYIKSSEAHHD